MIADPHEIQRLRYTPGQDLLSRDLSDQARFDEQLRFWHNRAAHGVYGVRRGLAVRLDAAAPPQFMLEVAPGLAYDGFGREVLLLAPRTLRVPAGDGETQPRLLVLRRRDEAGTGAAAGLAGGCPGSDEPQPACRPGGAGPEPLAEFVWRRAPRPDGVALARIVYADGAPALDPGFHPAVARPLARPRIGHGSTVSGGTQWSVWSPRGLARLPLVGLQVRIDTAAAGFTRPPRYFAWIQGAIPFPPGAGSPRPLPLPLFPHLADETPASLSLRLLAFGFESADQAVGSRAWVIAQARQRLSVCWLGIQADGGPDPLSTAEVNHGHP